MDNQKRIEILKKRNIALFNQLEDAKQKIQELENVETDKDKLESLMSDVESLREQFAVAIEDLIKARDKYIALNKELAEIKQDFHILSIPWYRKLFSKIGEK